MAKFLISKGIKVDRICFLLDINKSSIYYKSNISNKDKDLYNLIKQIAYKFTFYGYRRIHSVIVQKGFKVNHKKVYRIYKSLGLQKNISKKKIFKKINDYNFILSNPKHTNHIWAIDFAFDNIDNGKNFKCLVVQDIFSRFCICINVDFNITADSVTEVLKNCFLKYGKPKIIRSDRGPEFRADCFNIFLENHRIKHEFIPKGSPWENGNIESFIGKFRQECLNRNIFNSISEAKKEIEKYRIFYNNFRPHSAINGVTPYEYYKNNL
jgi:transposase InsO family protein